MSDRMISQTSKSHGGATHPIEASSEITLSHTRGALCGERLGDYQLGELLGVGGMAEVYEAEDFMLQREVAVKVLTAAVADDAGYAEQFRAEAHRLASFSHPYLVPVYHFGEAELQGQRLLFLVMPLLHESLRDLRRRLGKLPAGAACRLMLQVADGLEAVHRSGIIHRDVKPGNILLDMEGHPLLADFGIACELGTVSSGNTVDPNGLVVGTPEYMAPEQLCGDHIDQRADVYALGAVFYELLTGRPPFIGATAHDVAVHALYAPLVPPSALASDVDPAVEQVALTALARDPTERYATAGGFALSLRNAVIGQQTSSRQLEQPQRLPRMGPLVGWDSDDTMPAQFPPLPEKESWLEGALHWRRLWPLVLAAALLLLVFGAGHLLAASPYGAGPRIGAVPTIRAPAAAQQTPTVTTPPSTIVPPPTGLVVTNQAATKTKSQEKHHRSKPQGKHHGDGSQAERHGGNSEAEHHGDPTEVDRHGDRQEANHNGDRSEHASGHHHSHSKSM